MTPKASVLMPVYNAELYLAEAIESVLNQMYTEFEFIIIDDGSTDGSKNIIQEYMKSDGRIRFYSRENKGLVYTLNEAISLSLGEYLFRMDADDISLPTRMKQQLDYMEHNELDICGGHFILMTEFGALTSLRLVPRTEDLIKITLASGVPFAHPSIVLRKQFLLENDLSYGQSNYKNAEDLDLWIRMAEHNAIMGNLDEVVLKYRVLEKSLSRTNNFNIYRDTSSLVSDFLIRNKTDLRASIKKSYTDINDEERKSVIKCIFRMLLISHDFGVLRYLPCMGVKLILKCLASDVRIVMQGLLYKFRKHES